jgi:hypothetical protein
LQLENDSVIIFIAGTCGKAAADMLYSILEGLGDMLMANGSQDSSNNKLMFFACNFAARLRCRQSPYRPTRGTTALEMAAGLPHISAINIFGHIRNCREDNKELLQPIHFVYDKEPRNVALRQLVIFNIQLPHFPKELPVNNLDI